MKFRLWVAASAVALSACGGGGGGNGFAGLPIAVATSPTGSTPATPAPEPVAVTPGPGPVEVTPEPTAPTAPTTPTPEALTPVYEALRVASTNAEYLDQLNAQGARGFRNSEFLNAGYVKDSNTTYVYESLPTATDAAAWQAQLNAQGARGFMRVTDKGDDTFYRKDTRSTSTFTYTILQKTSPPLPTPPTRAALEAWTRDDAAAFVEQANAQGANGFYADSPNFTGKVTRVNIYRKDSASPAIYSYKIGATPYVTRGGNVQQYRFEGASGFLLHTVFGSPVVVVGVTVYVKDISQSATFEFTQSANSFDDGISAAAANVEARTGYVLFARTLSTSGTGLSEYKKATGCTGFLCGAQ
ncbi:hypothetical protein [Variovorax rhizosphaerae]|uniref:Lipoprotein n=1 Tax=Variovorax rhizosphaerae TaxID=1836200 RepID=A0ABU8WGR5_9BURK